MEEKSKEEEESSSKKTVAEYIKRCIFLIVGLCIMAVGVVLSIKAALGTSPISSIPCVLNLITGLTVGTTTIIVNTLIVLLQIVLLRKRFKLIQLLQIPVHRIRAYDGRGDGIARMGRCTYVLAAMARMHCRNHFCGIRRKF